MYSLFGDLIRVAAGEDGDWQLAQIPAAQAALVSLNPNNGAIVSMVGGIGFEVSKFNRATQAERQPGSNFKPFLYSAALDTGYTAATLIKRRTRRNGGRRNGRHVAPRKWTRASFIGPTRLRWALTKSRNLVSIRLLQQLGPAKLISYARDLGFDTSSYAEELSLALGYSKYYAYGTRYGLCRFS